MDEFFDAGNNQKLVGRCSAAFRSRGEARGRRDLGHHHVTVLPAQLVVIVTMLSEHEKVACGVGARSPNDAVRNTSADQLLVDDRDGAIATMTRFSHSIQDAHRSHRSNTSGAYGLCDVRSALTPMAFNCRQPPLPGRCMGTAEPSPLISWCIADAFELHRRAVEAEPRRRIRT